jgi:hypothetical protein
LWRVSHIIKGEIIFKFSEGYSIILSRKSNNISEIYLRARDGKNYLKTFFKISGASSSCYSQVAFFIFSKCSYISLFASLIVEWAIKISIKLKLYSLIVSIDLALIGFYSISSISKRKDINC